MAFPASSVATSPPSPHRKQCHREKILEPLLYISKAPITNLQAALAKQQWKAGGPQGTCMLYTGAKGSVQTDYDKRWRIKIPKLATASGGFVEQSQVNKLNAQMPRKHPLTDQALEEFYRNRKLVVFPEQDEDRLVNLIFVVLRVHQPDVFQHYLTWANSPTPAGEDITWVVCHRCHMGHEVCGNSDHLFLGNQRINMYQKNCSRTGRPACTQCGWVEYDQNNCSCVVYPNPAHPQGITPHCIKPTEPQRNMVATLRSRIEQLESENSRLRSELSTVNAQIEEMLPTPQLL
jgi:hypothetical protein